MYKCKFFSIHELVPSHIFAEYGDRAWQFMRPEILLTLDELRETYGSMTVNNYYWGGEREWSGLRTPNSPFYSETSQHSFGAAADSLFKNIDAKQVQLDILETPEKFPHIHGLELGVSWLHVDTRNVNGILTFTR